MWIRNKYLRSIVGLTLAVVLLMVMIPESGTADDSEYTDSDLRANNTQQANQYNPSHPRPADPRLIQASVNAYPELARNQPTRQYSPAQSLPPSPRRPSHGLPAGEWHNESPLGRVKMSVNGDKISINVDGAGEFAIFKPSLRGEFSVASDGTVYGLIHSVDLGIPAVAASEMGEELLLLDGLSDIPFSIRAYSEPEVLAIKQVNFGMPTQLAIATDGEFSELAMYVQAMLTGQYSKGQ